VILWLEIALLAWVLLQWHPPVTPFPPIFARPQSAPQR
jgi:hypothetical protein